MEDQAEQREDLLYFRNVDWTCLPDTPSCSALKLTSVDETLPKPLVTPSKQGACTLINGADILQQEHDMRSCVHGGRSYSQHAGDLVGQPRPMQKGRH